MTTRYRKQIIALTCLLGLGPLGHADDTDLYLNPSVPSGDEPMVMFTLDYRSNLGATACSGTECETLIEGGYLPSSGPYTFFDVLRGALKRVLDPLGGVKIGFMVNHANTCSGKSTSGPEITNCSNGGYVFTGFRSMAPGGDDPGLHGPKDPGFVDEDASKIALLDKLDEIPIPGGTENHSFQGKELYFELFRYLTGQGLYNGQLGYEDFGDPDKTTNLDEDFDGKLDRDKTEEVELPPEALSTEDRAIFPAGKYISPIGGSGCGKIFVINFMFQVSNQEDDSDDAIKKSTAEQGMGGINLKGRQNNFDTVIRYLKDADLANGIYGDVPDLAGTQNVLSYFLVDPTKINTTTNGYANAGGTGVALPLSSNPDELVATLNGIFKSILSVSTTFVAPSIPVNVFNRAQTVNEVFLALFQAEENGLPLWDGNLKKLIIGENPDDGSKELQAVGNISAIDVDGRIRREALTFWTSTPLPDPDDDEVAGADGRSVARGGAGQQIPGYVDGNPGLNNTNGPRKLFTEAEDPSNPTGLMPLNADAVTAEALWTHITADWSPPASAAAFVDAVSDDERAKAVNILRFARGLNDGGICIGGHEAGNACEGDNDCAGGGSCSVVRPWIFADPLHSRPHPLNYGARGSYTESNPDIRILIGTNDGAMHMIKNTLDSDPPTQSGVESWAFFPRATLPILDRLREQRAGTPIHPIGVDGSPVSLVIDADGNGTIGNHIDDKVYAYFGLRRGGKHYYALDITDPDSPALLWTLDKTTSGMSELGQTWSTPQIGNVKVGDTVLPVLVFGGGYNGDDGGDDIPDLGKDAKNRATRAGTPPAVGTDDDEGNALFIVNALDGTLVWKVINDASSGYNGTKKAFSVPTLKDSVPSEVTVIDTDGDNLLDRVYFGDTGGNLWRADLAGLKDHDNDASTPDIVVKDDPAVWSVMKLFQDGRHLTGNTGTNHDRRFFNRPDVIQSRDDSGPFDAVLIGSGDREDPLGTSVQNKFYVLKDRNTASGLPPTTTLSPGNLANLTSNCIQSSTCESPPILSNGWFIELGTTGEKNLAAAVTVGGSVFFTTFSPTPPANSCGLSEGQGRLFAVSLQDATALFSFDSTNDGDGTTYERADLLGSGGIPVEVVPLGEGFILVQGQEAGQNIMRPAGKTSFKTYWHERHE